MASFKLPGVSALSSQGNSFNLSNRVGAVLPSASGFGGAMGVSLGGAIKQNILRLGSGITSRLGIFGPTTQRLLGNLLYSQSDALAEMENREDPAMQIDWLIEMPGFDTSFNVNAYVEGVNLNTLSVDPITFERGGRRVNYAGGVQATPITIDFYEDASRSSTKYLQAWASKVTNKNGTKNYPSQYKKPIKVNVTNVKGEIVGAWLLVGCFPSGGADYQLASGVGDRIKFSREFTVDHVVFIAR